MAPAPRPELVVADRLDALVDAAAARIRAVAAAARSPRAAAFASRWRAARRRARSTRSWSTASTGRARKSSSATSAPCRPTTPSRTTAWRARRCSRRRACRMRTSSAGRRSRPIWTPPLALTSRPCARARPRRCSISRCWGWARTATRRRCFPAPRRWRSTTGSPWRSTSPALGARRLTLTYPVFLEAGEVFFLVTGRDKRAALADVLRPGSTLPAARIVQDRVRPAYSATRRPLKI